MPKLSPCEAITIRIADEVFSRIVGQGPKKEAEDAK